MNTLLLLIAGHFLADFPLQTDWIAKYKNPNNASPAPPGQTPQTIWPYVLTAHAATHGLCVGLVTGSAGLGVSEFVAHWVIDYGKCRNWYGVHLDQAFHLGCKIAWWLAWTTF